MPIYEYKCQRCRQTSSFFEKMSEVGQERLFFWKRKKCSYCGSRKLERVYSAFAARKTESYADMLNEMSKLGPVNFVPRPPSMPGPPPGGCPYAAEAQKTESASKTPAK